MGSLTWAEELLGTFGVVLMIVPDRATGFGLSSWLSYVTSFRPNWVALSRNRS